MPISPRNFLKPSADSLPKRWSAPMTAAFVGLGWASEKTLAAASTSSNVLFSVANTYLKPRSKIGLALAGPEMFGHLDFSALALGGIGGAAALPPIQINRAAPCADHRPA